MAHELEIAADGSASFAYSAKIGSAWHHLGVPMEDLSDVESILAACRADFEVQKDKLFAVDPTGVDGGIPTGKFFTWREVTELDEQGVPVSTRKQTLGIVGDDYRTIQNAKAVDLALHLISLTPDAQAIDCAGVLDEGRRFFCTIPLPELVIDPQGINDRHGRNLVVSTGHDGTRSLELVNSVTRAVCANTVSAALRSNQFHIKIRHVGNTDEPVALAKAELGLVLSANEEFEKAAHEMLKHDCSWSTVEKIAEHLWPRGDTPNQVKILKHDQRIDQLHKIWDSPTGAGGVGTNNWAAFNTFTEYMEHRQHIVGLDTVVNRADRAADSPGFNNRVHKLSTVFRTGAPLRALKAGAK